MKTINVAPLIVIVGPTASGKTGLSIKLAEKYNGEIICADSRTIYKYMNIGTAKPSLKEMRGVAHWGLDLVEPGEYFSAADFKVYANEKIEEIRNRGHVPFLVGGSGLYIDAVIFDYQFGNRIIENRRAELEKMSIDELHDYCNQHNIKLPENKLNKRYVMRAIEQNGNVLINRDKLINNAFVVGIATSKDELLNRISLRADEIVSERVVNEAYALSNKFGWDSEAMTGNIYRLIRKYIEKEMTLDDIRQKFITLDWRLAKRQMTWFKRNKCIKWLNLGEAERHISHLLDKRDIME